MLNYPPQKQSKQMSQPAVRYLLASSMAQAMQKILPRVIGGTEENGLGISYGNITAVLAEAVKTVYNDHVTPAKERISQLEDQNQKLIERLERLEALVSNKLLNGE